MLPAKAHAPYTLQVVSKSPSALPNILPVEARTETAAGLSTIDIATDTACAIFRLFRLPIPPKTCRGSDTFSSLVRDRSFQKLAAEIPAALAPGAVTVNNSIADYPAALLNETAGDVLAMSKITGKQEYLVVYNPCAFEPREVWIRVNYSNQERLTKMNILYGYDACGVIPVNTCFINGQQVSYIKLYLKPLHVAVLSN